MKKQYKSFKALGLKILLGVVFIVALLEGLVIFNMSKSTNNFSLPSYTFYDSKANQNGGGDALVSAKGSFISTTDLAFPVQTTQIDCWKEFNHCWIADATVVNGNIVMSDIDLKEIKYWNDDFIETAPSDLASDCVQETYRIDRRSKTVVYTRTTLNSTGVCEGIGKDPITATLGDGKKRLEIYNKTGNR